MPDLATHVAAAWGLGRAVCLVRPCRPGGLFLFAAGSALPDVLARAPHLVLNSAHLERLTHPLHVPATLILICAVLAFLFEERGRTGRFMALSLGALFHCLLDACQTIGPNAGYHWLYPFSDASPQLDLFSGEKTVLALPWVTLGAVTLECAGRLQRRRREGRGPNSSVDSPGTNG